MMCKPLIAEGKSGAAVLGNRVNAAATNCRKAKVCGFLLERRNAAVGTTVMERTNCQNRKPHTLKYLKKI
jgi:hypothetical protein